jgi:hypothetical protein
VISTFLLGPFLALLPKRLRDSLALRESIEWRWATMLSGIGESLLALAAMVVWYSYSVTTWVSRAMDAALAGKLGPEVNDQEIGFTGIMIFATHPLTWLIAGAGVEGCVRLVGAAFTENNLGILPLFVLDKIFLKLTGRSEPSASQAAGYTQGNLSSYLGAVQEKIRVSRTSNVPDELCVTLDETDEILEIRACRRKPDWTPPRTVRYQDTFYRLEACSDGPPPRPFRYRLRRLPAGVMGRTVLVYSPDETPILAK